MEPGCKKAEYLGAIGWIENLPLDANPYNPELEPDLFFFWDKGWRDFDIHAADFLELAETESE